VLGSWCEWFESWHPGAVFAPDHYIMASGTLATVDDCDVQC
jgi:hypothetical protein